MTQGERKLLAFVSSVMRPELDPWRAVTVSALSGNPALHPWAFEFTPPSASTATETYLHKVRDADFVIWLVGDTTTGPVRDEIAEALASNRRLWVIRLPAESRDELTEELLTAVRPRAKYGDVETPEDLRELLALTFTDAVIGALREIPDLTRLAYLEQVARASRARMVRRWVAAGLTRAEAIAFADDPSVGLARPSLLPTAEEPFRIVVAELGSGKSIFAERALQGAVATARGSAGAPAPVFLRAREVGKSLEAAVTERAAGLGDPRLHGAFIVVDGGDDVARDDLVRVVEDAATLVETWPETRVVLTSRPLATLHGVPEVIRMPRLSEEESSALVSRVAGFEINSIRLRTLPKPLSRAMSTPLFAILYGLRRRATLYDPPTLGALLSDLVERAIKSAQAPESLLWLRRLAVLTTDAASPVSAKALGNFEGRIAATDSGLVSEDRGSIEFTLPILEQWFAAQSLLYGDPGTEALTTSEARLYRWRYALAIALATGPSRFVDDTMAVLSTRAPGFAAEIVEDSIARFGSDESTNASSANAVSAGTALRSSLESWTEGIRPVGALLLRRNGTGQLLPLAVDAQPNWLTVGWYSGSEAVPDVVEFPQDTNLLRPNSPDWHPLLGRQWHDDPGWAWRWGLEMVRDDLVQVLEARALRIDCQELVDEALWLAALTVDRKGSLWSRPISMEAVEPTLVGVLQSTPVLLLKDRIAASDQVLNRLNELRDSGATHIKPPWPLPNIRYDDGRRLDTYTPEQQVLRIDAIFSAALRAYEEITSTWFATLRSRLVTAVTLPAHLVGNYAPSSQGRSGHLGMSTMDWYLEPLPPGSASYVTINLGRDRRSDTTERLQERYRRLRELRPEAADWVVARHSSGISDAFQPAPLAKLVYDWLSSDLKQIKWAK